jgi:hypothetical protein
MSIQMKFLPLIDDRSLFQSQCLLVGSVIHVSILLLIKTIITQYDINFIFIVVTMLFPMLRSVLSGFVFLIFCVCCSLAFVLLWCKVSILSFDSCLSELIFYVYFRCLKLNGKNSPKLKHIGYNCI